METIRIREHVVEFESDSHTYYVDGVEVPSISQICKMENPAMYAGIDQRTLSHAASKGVSLHKEIEDYERFDIPGRSIEFDNYLVIKEQLGFTMELSERMVIIEIDGKIACAGRFDMLSKIGEDSVLIDFKRTSRIHLDYVTLQLNLYRLGLVQSYGYAIDRLMMIRLRNYEANIIEVPIQETETLDVLGHYA
jgi:hypothetical protein